MPHWRLGLDVGSNSLGWAAVRLNKDGAPDGLLGAGVRIFSDSRDPQDKQSLAAQRRLPRGMRRNRDRKLVRRDTFMDALITVGLMPADAAVRKKLENPTGKRNGGQDVRTAFDPWLLRARGLNEKLMPHEFGRALFHLQQRRGFKSNRKVDKGDADKGKIADAKRRTAERLKAAGADTLGELFGRDRFDNPHAPVRARLHGEGAKAFYDFYPTRDLILDEFDKLWAAQAVHHPDLLTKQARETLRDILAFQRSLKPQPVGRCTLKPDDLRAPWALPSSQRRRIFETVNTLRCGRAGEAMRALAREERDKLAKKALNQKALTFDAMRTALGFRDEVSFNIESDKRKQIEGDHTAALLSKKDLWGKDWRTLSLAVQDAVAEILLGLEPFDDKAPQHIQRNAEQVIVRVAEVLDLDAREAEHWLTLADPDALAAWLAMRFDLDAGAARRIVDAGLPDGHQAFGRTANARVLAALEADIITYDKAVTAAGYADHRAHEGHGAIYEDKLPYYGEVLERSVAFGTGDPTDMIEKRIGKIANPTVHVSLNQIRKTVNRLIKCYGPPKEIVIELARDLPLSGEAKRKLEREQKENQEANERRRKTLEEHKAADTYVNRLKLRLWDELPIQRRECVLTGEQIGVDRLLSDEIEIDHILPFALTLDDGFNNKIIVTRKANRDKARKSPYDAFSHSPPGYHWEAIAARAADLPPAKRWRFAPDAMARFEDEERDFLARQLNDTKYIARLTRAYLGSIYGGGDEAMKHVWVTPGRLTSDLRQVWGLNSALPGGNLPDEPDTPARKNRDDHRHHAVDAVVIALTDRAMLKRAADHARGKDAEVSAERLLAGFGEPWPGFREEVERTIRAIIVSHKKDHGIAGALHEDTAYGVVQDPRTKEKRLATRKAITSFENRKQLETIADNRIREELLTCTVGLSGKEFKAKLQAYVDEDKPDKRTNPKRVRIHKVEADFRVVRHGRNGEHSKALIPGENYCVDIFETPEGEWRGAGVTRFDANRGRGALSKSFVPTWRGQNPHAILVMRVRKNDLIALEDEPGRRRIMRIVKLQPSNNTLALAEHFEAGKLQQRHDDKEDIYRWDFANFGKLKDRAARLVHVDEAGRVFDPGPRHAGTHRRSRQ